MKSVACSNSASAMDKSQSDEDIHKTVDQFPSPQDGHIAFGRAINPIHVGDFIYDETHSNRIGEGAYGCVYSGFRRLRSFSITAGRIYRKWEAQRVAIKKIPNSKVKPQEIEMMRLLRSPYLVSLLDIHETPMYTFVVMELCTMDLQKHIDLKMLKTGTGSLSEENLCKVLDNLGRGYNVLYHEAIVHRDIKPSNIMLKYSTSHNGHMGIIETAKITDFGISRIIGQGHASDDTSMSNVAGSMLYMAPEVGANLLNTKQYDAKVDMWSMGCVLYQCLSGNTPFDESSLCRLFLSAACSGNYPSYKGPSFPAQSPLALRKLLISLLEIDSSKRLAPPDFCRKAVKCAKGSLVWNTSYTNLNVLDTTSYDSHVKSYASL